MRYPIGTALIHRYEENGYPESFRGVVIKNDLQGVHVRWESNYSSIHDAEWLDIYLEIEHKSCPSDWKQEGF